MKGLKDMIKTSDQLHVEQLAVNAIRTLSINAVEKANSGHLHQGTGLQRSAALQ